MPKAALQLEILSFWTLPLVRARPCLTSDWLPVAHDRLPLTTEQIGTVYHVTEQKSAILFLLFFFKLTSVDSFSSVQFTFCLVVRLNAFFFLCFYTTSPPPTLFIEESCRVLILHFFLSKGEIATGCKYNLELLMYFFLFHCYKSILQSL